MRVIEVGLILLTVLVMCFGYKLQLDAHKLQTRPYVYLQPTDNTTLLSIDKTMVEYSLYVKNRSIFPASEVKSYGLVIVDGEPIHGISCSISPQMKETKELFETLNNCHTTYLQTTPNKKDIKVCVKNNLQSSDIQPESDITLRFSFSRKVFEELLIAKNYEESGIFIITTYKDYNGKETYSSKFGFIPYQTTGPGYYHKVF